ncbi:MAG: nuclear transport factor 2 family protein [Gammaproteobacteria bacterium]|nr:nuclear transport factor 2 family protein [Gammaproteobacteria bacterium]MCP5198729.1 nuclear transport factor 2 family protein [Gammaproteobacteria bacterium]
MPEHGSRSALVEDLVDACDAEDFARFRTFFADDFRFCHHDRCFSFDDADACVALLERFAREIIPARRCGPRRRLVEAGNAVAREQPRGGLVRQDSPGMARAGEHLQLDLCTVFVCDGATVAEYHDDG